jgi:hypothetical protein
VSAPHFRMVTVHRWPDGHLDMTAHGNSEPKDRRGIYHLGSGFRWRFKLLRGDLTRTAWEELKNIVETTKPSPPGTSRLLCYDDGHFSECPF